MTLSPDHLIALLRARGIRVEVEQKGQARLLFVGFPIDLRLAVPAIVAGLRIATVSTISIATIGSFVIPQGLGYPIFIGIKEDIFKTEIIAAGGLAILLALSADAILVVAQRALTPWRRA